MDARPVVEATPTLPPAKHPLHDEHRRVSGQRRDYSPTEWRAFCAGRAFAERIARSEQNTRNKELAGVALDAMSDDPGLWLEGLQRIISLLYPNVADLADQDPALARRALNALQPD